MRFKRAYPRDAVRRLFGDENRMPTINNCVVLGLAPRK